MAGGQVLNAKSKIVNPHSFRAIVLALLVILSSTWTPGSISLGGPIVTAGGLVFIAGTIDPFLRAFDMATGEELWKVQLSANGHATPMTYQLSPSGKQFLVIAAGGHAKLTEEPQSDALVAFTLP
jgi:quinoprotein glucose dehydrogenase